jgi:putative oxidoreductase
LVAASALIAHAVPEILAKSPAANVVVFDAFTAIAGVLLLAGLWTPVSGSLSAALALRGALYQPGDPWACILLATIGVALALVGPGAWSVDARLFGWKRIEVRDRHI